MRAEVPVCAYQDSAESSGEQWPGNGSKGHSINDKGQSEYDANAQKSAWIKNNSELLRAATDIMAICAAQVFVDRKDGCPERIYITFRHLKSKFANFDVPVVCGSCHGAAHTIERSSSA
jgi:hypothetical protein